MHLQNNESWFYVGICTPNQVNNVVVGWLGNKDCGGSFNFNSYYSYIICSGQYSRRLKEGDIKEGEEITAVVNNKNVDRKNEYNKKSKESSTHDSEYPQRWCSLRKFSCYNGSTTFSIISFLHVFVLPPPFNDGMRCLAYDFDGGFENWSCNHKDEEGKKIPNIKDYYQ